MRRSLDLYLELAERFLDASSRSFESALRDRRVGISGTEADAATNDVRLSAAAGGRASSRVWIHNRTDRPIVAAAFRATDLWSNRGDVIGSGSVHVDPATVTSLLAGESVSSTIVVDVEPGAASITYYGHIMLEGPDDVAVSLRLDVRPPAAPL
jgi:hypothetical protein